jgi:hypothetical protein
MRRQHNINLVIVVLSVITSWRDNYILLFKDSILVTKGQTPLRFIIYDETEYVFKGMARLNPQEWL